MRWGGKENTNRKKRTDTFQEQTTAKFQKKTQSSQHHRTKHKIIRKAGCELESVSSEATEDTNAIGTVQNRIKNPSATPTNTVRAMQATHTHTHTHTHNNGRNRMLCHENSNCTWDDVERCKM
jgi:hypothetical protein